MARVVVGADVHGFPAHAGIDPDLLRLVHPQVGFPRPRGDRPSAVQVSVVQIGVSPAHAGIDRRHQQVLLENNWFPRPRGDRPSGHGCGNIFSLVSPPTRG